MKTVAALSKVQYGLYVECVAHQGEACYNLPYLYVLDGSLDGERLRRSIEAAVSAHPTLFTRIELNGQGDALQTVDDSETFSLTIEHGELNIEDGTFNDHPLIVPFNIYEDRLFHIRLLKDAAHYYFFLDIHHIIGDGTTLKVMLSDVDAAYRGETLAPEAMTMAEVAQAEAELRKTSAFEEGKQWYAQNFDCSDCYTPLLPDLEEPEHTEASMVRTLSVDMARVDAFCKGNGIFKSNFFTTAYSFLLAKYNNEQESLFVTIYNGRTDKRFLHSVGMTVKSVPVYAKFDDDTRVLDYLKAGQEQMAGCRKHEAYAYSDIVNDLGVHSNTTFAWHGLMFSDEELCGKPMKTIRLCNSTVEVSLYLKAFILNGKYQVKAEYSSDAYSKELISQFLESYEAVVEGFLSKEYLRDIDITTASQIEVLDSFNETDQDFDDTQTIVSVFRKRTTEMPDKPAVVYKEKSYTYREVDEISDRIATYLVAKGLGAENVVSILIPRCEWMAIASLGVMKAGCAYQPLDPTYPAERLNFMMKDAEAKLLIADEELLPIVNEYDGEVLLTKDLLSCADVAKLPAGPKPEDLFILLYTSGSTGVPKGVMLEQRNLTAFCAQQTRACSMDESSRWGAYASFGFDASTMELWATLYAGGTVYIIPEKLRFDLVALNDYFEQNGITHSFMTTQVGRQFVNDIDNHSLKSFMTGGEKLADVNPPHYQFQNGYGPTETICFITLYPVTKKEKNIPIGKGIANTHLYIVDPQGHRLPVGASGELWISGPQVSRGYLKRPEKTSEAYINNPFTNEAKYGRIYKTGDIVRYLPDGNIQFVGRRDGQVKIRGFRIELKEIESVIREFPGIKDATVQAFDEENGNGKFVAAYIVSNQQIDIEALNNFILDQKPPYMVPAVTMQIDTIPLNQNQKVNKRALPKPVKKAAVAQESNVPLNVLEEELHEMIAAIVNTSDFGITTVLGYAGLTSISAIKLAVQVNKRFGVTLDSKMLVKNGTIQSIENEILKQVLAANVVPANTIIAAANPPLPSPNSQLKSVPLSYAQTGVYFECLKNPTSTIYNIPSLLTYPDDIEAVKLADAVKQVIEAHPELSIHFTTNGDAIVQTLEESVPVEVGIKEMSDKALTTYKNEFVRPFNLQKAPLYRFEVVKTESGVHLLMDVHHLVFDGGSADLLIRQISSVLDGSVIENETYTYLDFVSDQQKAEGSDTFKAAQQFFAEKLQTCEGASEIPVDLSKTDKPGFIGEVVCPVRFDHLTSQLSTLNSHPSSLIPHPLSLITPAHLFLAATSYVISRYTNNRDVYLCTVSSGRSNLKIADTVGMFVNTLALGLSIDDVTVEEFLRLTSETFEETLRHEDFPFARIASDYGFRPSIAFAYQVGVLSQFSVGGKLIQQELLELNVPKFKINIKVESRGLVVQYDDALYSSRLAYSLAESIVTVAEHMMDQPQARVRQLSIVSKSQEEELSCLRQTALGDSQFRFFHECISHFAKTQPDHDALIACDAKLTYAELDAATNRLAYSLIGRGVKARSRIALLLPRTSKVIIAMFGTMKAGCAYIPCDPEYPTERIQHILSDSHASLIITTANRVRDFENAVDVDTLLNMQLATFRSTSDRSQDENSRLSTMQSPPHVDITPQDLAYLIYTSGSTGKPKGVTLRHESIVNYLTDHPANSHIHALVMYAHSLLSVTTLSFDMSLKEVGSALFNGLTLVLASEEQATNPILLADLFKRTGADAFNATPSRMMQYMELPSFHEAIAQCKVLMCGGEKYADGLLPKLRESAPEAHIFNTYGPTEITVSSNAKDLTHTDSISVGRPLLNYTEFIVDKDGNELPIGVVGELYIGGIGVATGYNDLPEMTAERFIEYNGIRIYKSGDYARWTEEGDVVILGRTDNQIKLRGLRIELGEVEAALAAVEGIKNVVVKIGKIKDTEHLCAYFTANRPIDISLLKGELGKTLTKYMVPTAYLQLEEMPLTPNGKTDVKALPEPVLAISGNYEAPANTTEQVFADIFAKILQVDRVGATDNFFELGGTSLVVTRIIIEADKAGFHVAYGDVFANPTPRQLARFITGDTADDSFDEITDFNYTAINNLLQRNTLTAFRQGERQALGNVLLTGATGYLGIHILRELIDSEAQNIYCLVRGKSLEKAESRLRTLLYYYFADAFKELFGQRLHVVLGDVTNDIDEHLKVDTVFNCAAIVKHFSEGTEIEDVNIGGAQRCMDFCIKTGAELVHISTASTRGIWAGEIKDDVYTEQRLYMGQYLGNKYIYSKFMAERLILQAVSQHGLNAKIMRVGNLAARSTDGEFQANFSTNSFMGRIRVYNMLGCCPYAMRNKRVEFSPINEVARAIVLLASTPKECTVFHPYNIHGQFLGDVLTGLTSVGKDIRFVEQEEFQQAIDQAGADPQKAKQMASLLAYQDMAHGRKTAEVMRDNNYTTQVLYRLGFAFSPTSWDYVERMLTTIGGFGFFEEYPFM